MNSSIHVYLFIYEYIHMYIHIHNMYVHTYIYMYIHTYHMYTLLYTLHTFMYTCYWHPDTHRVYVNKGNKGKVTLPT